MSEEPIIRENANGRPSVRGTRLTVYNIMDHHLAGSSAEWIAQVYKIPVADAQAAMDYIDQHRAELMPKYERGREWARHGNPPHIEALLAESHKKLMARKRELEQKALGEPRDAAIAG